MKMNLKGYQWGIVLGMMILIIACKKPEERTCWKGAGEYAEIEYAVDSIRAFHLNKNIKYRFYQDNERKIVVKGGENLIQQVAIDNRDNVLYATNLNNCHFLRNPSDRVEVEIHYPHYDRIYVDPTDSVVFENTITGYNLDIEIRNGGGSLIIDTDLKNKLTLVVSFGAGDFTLSGKAKDAELKIQNNGSANCVDFRATYIFLYQNSTADFFANLDDVLTLAIIDGTGDVFHLGIPKNLTIEGEGNGQLIKL
jgi:hypothetical protein